MEADVKDFIATLVKVFHPESSLKAAKRELADSGRDLRKVYGRNWSDRGHF